MDHHQYYQTPHPEPGQLSTRMSPPPPPLGRNHSRIMHHVPIESLPPFVPCNSASFSTKPKQRECSPKVSLMELRDRLTKIPCTSLHLTRRPVFNENNFKAHTPSPMLEQELMSLPPPPFSLSQMKNTSSPLTSATTAIHPLSLTAKSA